jgi:hypothetical protein
MAKLPTKEELGGNPSLGRTGVAVPSVPNMTGIFGTGEGMQKLAAGIGDLGEGIMAFALQKKEENNAVDVLNADAQFNKSKLELERSILNDPVNHGTAGVRYTDGVQKGALPSSASLIRDPATRAKWLARRQADADDGLYRIYGWSDKVDREEKRGSIENSMDTDSKAYSDPYLSNRERLKRRETMNSTLKFAVDSGLYSPAEAEQLNKKYKIMAEKELATVLAEINPRALVDETNGHGPFKTWLGNKEGSGDYTKMELHGLGYAGKYQVGAPLLNTIGVYTPGPGENLQGKWGGRKWSGFLNIPGHPEVTTVREYLMNPEAQEAVMDMVIDHYDQEIEQRGLDKYLGSSVTGNGQSFTITREGLYAMIHLGGGNGAQRALEGRGVNADINGTSVFDYAAAADAAHKSGLFANMLPAERALVLDKADKKVRMNDTLTFIASNDSELGAKAVAEASATFATDYSDQVRLENALARREKDEAKIKTAETFADPHFVFDPTDATHKKYANLATEEAPAKLMAGDEQYFNEVIMPTYDHWNAISGNVKGAFEAMIRSDDPNKVVWAFKHLEQMERSNPLAFKRDMGADTLEKLLFYQSSIPYMNSQAFFDKLRQLDDPSKAKSRDEAGKAGREIAKAIPTEDVIGSFDDSWWSSGPQPIDGLSAGELRVEFDERMAEQFRMGVTDPNKARENVNKLLKTVWGKTAVTGTADLMKYPPENFYPMIGGNHEWMNTQFAEFVKDQGLTGSTKLGIDAETVVDINRRQTPSYTVLQLTEGGSYEPVVNKQTGKPLRIEFNPQGEAEEYKQRKLEQEAAWRTGGARRLPVNQAPSAEPEVLTPEQKKAKLEQATDWAKRTRVRKWVVPGYE